MILSISFATTYGTCSIRNCLNPDWVKTFTINHDPKGEVYFVTVTVYDNESNDKPLGSATFQLSSILEADGNTKTFTLLKGGSLHVRAEVAVGSGILKLKMSGESLKSSRDGCFMIRKSDPFYQFVRRELGEK